MDEPVPTVSVRLLQTQHLRLQERVRSLEEWAQNERLQLQTTAELTRAGTAVIRSLCHAPTLDEGLDALRQYLQTYFDAQYCALFLFTNQQVPLRITELQVKPLDDAARRSFLALFEHNLPLCDSLQDEHLQLLLGGARATIQATVLIPVSYPQTDALLVLGSPIADRYCRGSALDFLVSLTETAFAVSRLRLALE